MLRLPLHLVGAAGEGSSISGAAGEGWSICVRALDCERVGGALVVFVPLSTGSRSVAATDVYLSSKGVATAEIGYIIAKF